MYILSGNEREIVNSDFVERFVIVERIDNNGAIPVPYVVIGASYSDTRLKTLAVYETVNEAAKALGDLFGAIAGEQNYYRMPESSASHEQVRKRDARTKRRGGS